jgi:hypothetical protein
LDGFHLVYDTHKLVMRCHVAKSFNVLSVSISSFYIECNVIVIVCVIVPSIFLSMSHHLLRYLRASRGWWCRFRCVWFWRSCRAQRFGSRSSFLLKLAMLSLRCFVRL